MDLVETRKQTLIAEAERHIAAAVNEGGLSPAHERMIDAMQAIVEILKTEPDFYLDEKGKHGEGARRQTDR